MRKYRKPAAAQDKMTKCGGEGPAILCSQSELELLLEWNEALKIIDFEGHRSFESKLESISIG